MFHSLYVQRSNTVLHSESCQLDEPVFLLKFTEAVDRCRYNSEDSLEDNQSTTSSTESRQSDFHKKVRHHPSVPEPSFFRPGPLQREGSAPSPALPIENNKNITKFVNYWF